MHVLLDGAVEFFYQKEKIARFDSKTTHAFGLYRTNRSGKGSAMDLFPLYQLKTFELSP